MSVVRVWRREEEAATSWPKASRREAAAANDRGSMMCSDVFDVCIESLNGKLLPSSGDLCRGNVFQCSRFELYGRW